MTFPPLSHYPAQYLWAATLILGLVLVALLPEVGGAL